MKTIINLKHEEAKLFSRMLKDHIENNPTADDEDWGWKLIFHDNGLMEVWNGRHGIKSDAVQYKR